jgi:hypothetical protein
LIEEGEGVQEEEKYLRPNNPSDSPPRKSEALSESIDNQHIILIYILNVLCCRNGGSVAVRGIVISSVELVHHEGCTVTANILDL